MIGRRAGPVPLGNRISAGDRQVFRPSGGMRVLDDQAAQHGFSADLMCVDAGHGGAGTVAFAIGDMLRDALVRPGGVVARLELGQDGVHVPLGEDRDRSRNSRRNVPTRRTQIAFTRGAGTAVRRILVPVAWNTGRTGTSTASTYRGRSARPFVPQSGDRSRRGAIRRAPSSRYPRTSRWCRSASTATT
jgi:hypothetical protein